MTNYCGSFADLNPCKNTRIRIPDLRIRIRISNTGYENRKFTSNVLQKLKRSYNVSLLLLKIDHSFFQESIDNNKSIGGTIYRCQIQAIIKKRKTFEVFKLIYFKKPPIKKIIMKLRVLSDASVLLKCWFYKQAPQKVLIELSPGVVHISPNTINLKIITLLFLILAH